MFTVANRRPIQRRVAGYLVSAVEMDGYAEVMLFEDGDFSRGEAVWSGDSFHRTAAFLAICHCLERGGEPADYVWRWDGTGMVAIQP